MPDDGGPVKPATAGTEFFRYAPARPVIELMAITWLGGLIGAAGMWAVSGARFSVVVLAVVGFQVNAGGLMHWFVLRRSGVRVGPNGLVLRTPLQSDRHVRWADVHTARWRHLLLTPRLILQGPGGRLALPFVLDDPEGFAEAVAAYAGDDHPLTVALHQRLAVG